MSFICYLWRLDDISFATISKSSNAGNLETPTTFMHVKNSSCCYIPTEHYSYLLLPTKLCAIGPIKLDQLIKFILTSRSIRRGLLLFNYRFNYIQSLNLKKISPLQHLNLMRLTEALLLKYYILLPIFFKLRCTSQSEKRREVSSIEGTLIINREDGVPLRAAWIFASHHALPFLIC